MLEKAIQQAQLDGAQLLFSSCLDIAFMS